MKIAIDAGHGMSNRKDGLYDPGAVWNGIEEADITLQWALTGKWVLAQEGIVCYLIRDDDSDKAPVWQRNDWAEQMECTRYISLHCNAASNASHVSGTETYARFDDKTGQNNHAWATIVNHACVQALKSKDRGVKTESESQHDKLAVLDFKNGPACLLEIGFITNPIEATLMMQRKTRLEFWQKIAKYLATLS
jgi:N-acetylmuramoyl-L-alanine amidase